jgi:hypothetical protein
MANASPQTKNEDKKAEPKGSPKARAIASIHKSLLGLSDRQQHLRGSLIGVADAILFGDDSASKKLDLLIESLNLGEHWNRCLAEDLKQASALLAA